MDEKRVLVVFDSHAMFWISFFLETADYTASTGDTHEGRPVTAASGRLCDPLAATIGHFCSPILLDLLTAEARHLRVRRRLATRQNRRLSPRIDALYQRR